MTNKKIKRATGSYTQELVNNQPVVPTVPVQNPTVAAGGNSYQAYVNQGAPTTPVQMRSVVTPVQNPTVQMEGQYTRNLVKPKQMKNEVGGSEETGGDGVETGGEKKEFEVEDPNSYIAALREREESIVDQYDASVNYAEETKKDAYKKAEDQYNIAMREAQGNFRANQPTYGARAEQLLASGLTGGGYSDYLGGKAYEARTDEINAARSQMSYAEQLADSNYRDMMYQANTDKYNQQAALDQWKLDYGVQLDAEYKAKVEEILAGIAAGSYTAEIAKKELENYAPNGVISENIIGAIDAAEYEYWKKNDAALLAEYMTYVEAEIANGGLGSRELMRDYLKNSSKLTDTQIEVYLDAYYNADGSLKDAKDRPSSGNSGSTGNTGGTGGSANNAKDENLTDAVNYLRTKANMGKLDYASSYTAFKESMEKHKIGDGEDYNKLINEMKQLVKEGKFDPTAAAAIEDMTGGLVVGSGAFEENRGLRKKFQKGDNFTVTVGGNSYKVDSAGEAGGDVQAVASNLADGVVFGYGSELYLKSGDTAYKIKARALFGNKDYNELWKAVYGEVIDNIAKVDVSTLETDDEKLNAAKDGFVNPENKGNRTEKTNMFQNMFKDRQEATKNNAGKFFDLFKKDNISGEKLEEMAPPFTNDTLPAPDNSGNTEGGGEPAPDNGESNSTNLTGTVTRATDTANAKFKNDAWGSRTDLSKGDNFNIEVNGKTYRVESGGEVNPNLRDFFNTQDIGDNEVFEYDGEAYLKKGGSYYSIDTRLWMGKQEDKLIDAIKSNEHGRSGIAKGFSGKVTITDDEQNPEGIRFIPANDGQAMLYLSPDEDTRTNYAENQVKGTHNEKDKFDLPREARIALRGIKDDVAVVYSGGKFYIKYINGNSTKYYEFTPRSEQDRDDLIKALN